MITEYKKNSHPNYRRNAKARNTFNGSNNNFHLLLFKDKVYPSPDSFYSLKEIQKSIDAHDDKYKILFNMFIDGYKYKEIAEKMNVH